MANVEKREAADKAEVPAGGALAVDREEFSGFITDSIKNNPLIHVKVEEVDRIPDNAIVVVASGPLTDGKLYDDIMKKTGESDLHFFDAAAPIVSFASIDMTKAFFQSRYGKGGNDYINCPMNEEEYKAFYNELVAAQKADVHGFDKINVFEGCMPIEVMAERGEKTMTFGPMKPVGLEDPKTGKRPYAVVQLRQDDAAGTLYNIVGFQTHLKWPEQKRVFSMIPGLENIDIVRYGVMHRNTYINSPKLLNKYYQMRKYPKIFFAGQITGVEGYVESASSGILAGYNMARLIQDKPMFEPDARNCIGALPLYISNETNDKLQPMNANFGIIAHTDEKIKGGKKIRYQFYADRALETIEKIKARI